MVARTSKQPRSGIYASGLLFVPLPEMWALHDLARDLRVRGWPELPQAVLYRRIKKKAPRKFRLPASVDRWGKLYLEVKWYRRWLLRGEDAPPNVFVPELRLIKLCLKAWHARSFCKAAGFDGQTYDAWFKQGLFPTVDWVKWLYGSPPPQGAFVVGENLRCLRATGAEDAICAAAKVYGAGPRQWRRDPVYRETLDRLIKAAPRSGGHLPDLPDWPEDIPERTRGLMRSYAQQTTWLARQKAAKPPLPPAGYSKAMALARQLGVESDLKDFLNVKDQYVGSGLVAKNFFIPTPAMLDFREAAQGVKQVWFERVSYQKKVMSLKDVPGFDEWFYDWTAPRKKSGLRRALLTCNDTSADNSAAATPDDVDAPSNGEPLTPMAGVKPRWDKDRRELWFGDKLCYRFSRAPLSQGTILSSFEELDWPARMDDPLSPGQLKDALKNLRTNLRTAPIEISGDGSGKGIIWRVRKP